MEATQSNQNSKVAKSGDGLEVFFFLPITLTLNSLSAVLYILVLQVDLLLQNVEPQQTVDILQHLFASKAKHFTAYFRENIIIFFQILVDHTLDDLLPTGHGELVQIQIQSNHQQLLTTSLVDLANQLPLADEQQLLQTEIFCQFCQLHPKLIVHILMHDYETSGQEVQQGLKEQRPRQRNIDAICFFFVVPRYEVGEVLAGECHTRPVYTQQGFIVYIEDYVIFIGLFSTAGQELRVKIIFQVNDGVHGSSFLTDSPYFLESDQSPLLRVLILL